MKTTTVYLLHFNRKYKHAQHYIGSTSNLELRIQAHREGKGARLIKVITDAGISFTLARTWEGDKKEERRLKNVKHSNYYCPICKKKKRKKNSAIYF